MHKNKLSKSLAIADGFLLCVRKAVINMSRMTVSRSYKQLMAERNAMRLMIYDKEKRIVTGERIATGDFELRMLEMTKRELESDKALLKEIENDIQVFRERNRM